MKRPWAVIKPYLLRAGRSIAWFFRRFQIIRWAILLVLLATLALSTWFTYKAKTADVQNIKSSLQLKTTIYDGKDVVAGELYGQKGAYVPLSQIAPSVQNAVIATEDRSFYSNPGFDIKGIARAAISYVVHRGAITGGGSTITQQLAKNTLLSQSQTFMRKGQEIFLAVQLTKVYSKNDILAMYLNNAYFGNGVWGVQDASLKYFGKNASELSTSEGATLAAMLRNPTFYNPIDHMDHAISRRNLVLGLQVEAGKLSAGEAATAKAAPLTLVDRYANGSSQKYPYYFDAVITEAGEDGISADDVVNKGYKIYTNLNQAHQTAMQERYDNPANFPGNAPDGTLVQSGSVALDPNTGGVTAVVGARGEHVYLGFNYATQAKRSPGSTLKPLMVYTTALENGYSYDSELTDQPLSYGSDHYTPTNESGTYAGQVPMYKALADSLNAPAVWLMDQVGVNKGVKKLAQFGIPLKKEDENLAAVLGGVSTGYSPLTMARAYGAFANGGTLQDTHFIRKIVDASGKTVVDHTKPSGKRVISKNTAKEMTSMGIGVFNDGTGRGAKPYGYTIAGKTGTVELPREWGVNGISDHWMIGYTPDIVVATWVGFPTTDQAHYLTSYSAATTIFKAEMGALLPETAGTAFDTTDAKSRAELQTVQTPDGTSGDWWDDLQNGVKNGVEKAKDAVGEWYNNIKDWLDGAGNSPQN